MFDWRSIGAKALENPTIPAATRARAVLDIILLLAECITIVMRTVVLAMCGLHQHKGS